MIIGITGEDANEIIDFLLKNNVGSEPIDGYDLCRRDLLLSALKTPFQRPEKENRESDFIDKASRVYFSLILNHCLPTNGNKRFATQVLLVMAYLNNFSIKTTEYKLYAFPYIVTYLSKYVSNKEEIIGEIEEFIKNTLEPRKQEHPKEVSEELERTFLEFLQTRE